MSRRIEWYDARHTVPVWFEGGTVIGEHTVDEQCTALALTTVDSVAVIQGTKVELHKLISAMMEALNESSIREPGDFWAGHSYKGEDL